MLGGGTSDNKLTHSSVTVAFHLGARLLSVTSLAFNIHFAKICKNLKAGAIFSLLK